MAKGRALSRVSKSTKRGGLHRSLGIPMGQKIGEARIEAAAKKPGKVGKEARLAETYNKYRGGKGKARSPVRKVRSY